MFQFERAVFLVLGLVLVIAVEQRNNRVRAALTKGEMRAGFAFGLASIGLTMLLFLLFDAEQRLIPALNQGGVTVVLILLLGLNERRKNARILSKTKL